MARKRDAEAEQVVNYVEAGHGKSAVCPHCGTLQAVNDKPEVCGTCSTPLDYDEE